MFLLVDCGISKEVLQLFEWLLLDIDSLDYPCWLTYLKH